MSFGYRHRFLDEYETFWASGAKTTRPLKNDIHPLWKQDNFRMGGRAEFGARCRNGLQWDDPRSRMPDALYKAIEPALRLASMFLAHSRPFFMMVLRSSEVQVRGINVVLREGLLRNRTSLPCLDPTWVPGADDEKAYDEAMGQIAADFRLYCGEDYTTILPGLLCYAATCGSAIPSFWIYNDIARGYFEEISSSRFKHNSMQQRQRLLFQFATVLLHELAHVLCWKRREADLMQRIKAGGPYEPEPLFHPTDVAPELGHAWEIWAFGAMINPTGYPLDMRIFGFRWRPWLWAMHPHNAFCLDFPHSEFIIHASTISRFFSTAGWENHKNGSKPLTVELTPLRGIYACVEDKDDDDYAETFRWRLDHVHRGMSSALIRNHAVVSPTLPPIPLPTDDLVGPTPDLRQT